MSSGQGEVKESVGRVRSDNTGKRVDLQSKFIFFGFDNYEEEYTLIFLLYV